MRAIDRCSADGFRKHVPARVPHCAYCGGAEGVEHRLRSMRIRTNVGMQRVDVCETCRVNVLGFLPERKCENNGK